MTDRDRQIVELILEGTSVLEISEKMECSERKVERVREKLRGQLEEMMA